MIQGIRDVLCRCRRRLRLISDARWRWLSKRRSAGRTRTAVVAFARITVIAVAVARWRRTTGDNICNCFKVIVEFGYRLQVVVKIARRDDVVVFIVGIHRLVFEIWICFQCR